MFEEIVDPVEPAAEVEEEAENDDATGEESDKGADPYANLTPEELKERLKVAESTIVKNKRNSKPPVNKPNPSDKADIPEWGKTLLSTEEKRQFGQAKNLSNETVDAVFKYNGGVMPSDEMMQTDPAIKAIVSDFEGRRRVASNTPKGGAVPIYKGKTFAEVVTDPKASKDDKQGAFEAAQKKHGIK